MAPLILKMKYPEILDILFELYLSEKEARWKMKKLYET
jgi:hypothetical protein